MVRQVSVVQPILELLFSIVVGAKIQTCDDVQASVRWATQMLLYQHPGFQQHLSHSSTNPVGFTYRLETCSSVNLANASTYPSQKQPVQHKPLHEPNQKPAPSTTRKKPVRNRPYIHHATIVQHNYNKRQTTRKTYIVCLCFLCLVTCLTKQEHNTLEVVPHVDLEKYLGKWYEIAHLPARFQKDCTHTTATYTLTKDGNISVLNECIRNGKAKQAKGKAKIADKKSGAKLKVTFFWPFYGDYWIIDLGKDYDYAVVGTPNRKYLWILCRTPQMDDQLLSRLTESAKSKGFDMSNLIKTSHIES